MLAPCWCVPDSMRRWLSLTRPRAAQVTVNAQRDVCGVHKAGGVAISSDQLMRCVRIAAQQAVSSIATLQETVAGHRAARLAGRVRRHREALPTPGFVLGARLGDDSDARGAQQAPAYFAGGEDSDAEDFGGVAAPSWDDVAPAVTFPFAGPLLPASASKGGADGDDAPETHAPDAHMPVRAARLQLPPCSRPDDQAAGVACGAGCGGRRRPDVIACSSQAATPASIGRLA